MKRDTGTNIETGLGTGRAAVTGVASFCPLQHLNDLPQLVSPLSFSSCVRVCVCVRASYRRCCCHWDLLLIAICAMGATWP